MLKHPSGLVEEPAEWLELQSAAETGRLYAVIDACNMPPVLARAETTPSRCLHGKPGDKGLWASAPWLFQADADLLDWVKNDLYHQPWGFFLVSGAGFDAVFAHLKTFEFVANLDKKKFLFRYYDPRVLVPFLLSSTATEIRHFFGPIEQVTSGMAQASLVHFRYDPEIEGETYPHHTFRLTEAHSSAFFTYDEEKFLAEVIEFVLDEFPRVHKVESDTLEIWVENGIKRARRNGFSRANDLMTFVALMFEFAPDFDKHPQVRAILDDPDLPTTQKLDVMLDRIPDGLWNQIGLKSDHMAWFEE
ncbi:DUF4123 domain-containing protein [Sulfidibacter corallicola]|uniref:DUF4123 domain-containing protein n=1 Tax=Sulfidibacter corallicola TaxID=2818388 RepID=A0A8A4TSD0_SULCO|nr:DUF4123 domain-containing protein [Sulfidibacter corallicola]QTD52297.1 DUF4123 domain-containing protein [Sulfidibacter corallicola]